MTPIDRGFSGDTKISDLISRQDALDEIQRFYGYLDEDMINRIHIGLNRLPSAQSEIIRCKDCRFEDGVWYCNVHFMDVEPNGFCYLAKRKEI